MVTGGQGVPLRVHVRGSEIKEQVAEQRPDALDKEDLETEDEGDDEKSSFCFFFISQQCVFFLSTYPTVASEAHHRPAYLRAEVSEVHGHSGARW